MLKSKNVASGIIIEKYFSKPVMTIKWIVFMITVPIREKIINNNAYEQKS